MLFNSSCLAGGALKVWMRIFYTHAQTKIAQVQKHTHLRARTHTHTYTCPHTHTYGRTRTHTRLSIWPPRRPRCRKLLATFAPNKTSYKIWAPEYFLYCPASPRTSIAITIVCDILIRVKYYETQSASHPARSHDLIYFLLCHKEKGGCNECSILVY